MYQHKSRRLLSDLDARVNLTLTLEDHCWIVGGSWIYLDDRCHRVLFGVERLYCLCCNHVICFLRRHVICHHHHMTRYHCKNPHCTSHDMHRICFGCVFLYFSLDSFRPHSKPKLYWPRYSLFGNLPIGKLGCDNRRGACLPKTHAPRSLHPSLQPHILLHH